MALTVLTGGARSGKSALAVRIAQESGTEVTVIATAEAGDEEFEERIAAHRAARPDWPVLEEPLRLEAALRALPDHHCALVDCLSLWVANVLAAGGDPGGVEGAARSAAATAAGRSGPTIAVTNEVGLGIVPANALARSYRDLLGTVNRTWVAAADRAALVVAGGVLPLADWRHDAWPR
jgi:adenosylcobinamide kinase / adenosylcobinamide-phosphate guanylyltransferase